MKNISIVTLVLLLAVVFISFRGLQHHRNAEHHEMSNLFASSNQNFEAQFANFPEFGFLDPNDLVVVEVEENVDLGFDTATYLPLGFNAYAGIQLEAEDIEVEEIEEEVNLGFDPALYLPANFNAFAK